ncbi:MAG: alpha/beta hydrolase [Deltaproteobacteria bacterium]|nr:alpha/beta hydrolase [Candidatus Tharpella aukensis]
MQEKSIIIRGECELEAGLALGSESKGVILAHPHPLYGGDMRNPVVTTMMDTFQKHDWSTLRFNFRGVGASCGTFDAGRGEVDDLLAAVDHLRQEGVEKVLLAGYSFGAWVIFQAAVAGRVEQEKQLFVAPPAAMMEFGSEFLPGLELVVVGEEDDIAPPEKVGPLAKKWNPVTPLVTVAKADHFFTGCMGSIGRVLERFLQIYG